MLFIQEATTHDATTVAEIYWESVCFAMAASNRLSIDEVKRSAIQKENLIRFFSKINKDSYSIIALEEQFAVGIASLNLKTCELEAMFVRPKFFRKGIANSMLQHLEEKARLNSISKIFTVASLFSEEFFIKSNFEYKDNLRKEIELSQAGLLTKGIHLNKSLQAISTN